MADGDVAPGYENMYTAGIQKLSRGENGEKTVIVSQILSGFVLGEDCGKIKCFIRIQSKISMKLLKTLKQMNILSQFALKSNSCKIWLPIKVLSWFSP
jgi:hypothetical protein